MNTYRSGFEDAYISSYMHIKKNRFLKNTSFCCLLLKGKIDVSALKNAWLNVFSETQNFDAKNIDKNEKVNVSSSIFIEDYRNISLEECELKFDEALSLIKERIISANSKEYIEIHITQYEENIHRIIAIYNKNIHGREKISNLFLLAINNYLSIERNDSIENLEISEIKDKENVYDANQFLLRNQRDVIGKNRSEIGSFPQIRNALGFQREEHDSECELIYSSVKIKINKQVSDDLKYFAAIEKMPLSIILITSWAIFLSRLLGENNIAFRLHEFSKKRNHDLNRIREDIVKITVNYESEYQEFLTDVRQQSNFYSYSFRDQSNSCSLNDIDSQTICDSSIYYDSSSVIEKISRELKYLNINIENFFYVADDPRVFDVQLYFNEGINLLVSYCNNFFNENDSRNILTCYETLLVNLIRNKKSKIGYLSIFKEGEIEKTVNIWNRTECSYPESKSIHRLFEEQVESTPEAIAVVFEEQYLSYFQLNNCANNLARYLIKSGCRCESQIGIFSYRSIDMLIGILGSVKAGGAYLPIDPFHPEDRIKFIISNSKLSIILTQKELLRKIPGDISAKVVCLNELRYLKDQTSPNPNINVFPNNAAYTIYTSGSTGNPKGVVSQHRGLINRINWMQKKYQLTREDSVLQKTPYSFDVSVWEFFWPIVVGAKLVFARPEGHKDPKYLVSVIGKYKISTLHFVPSMLEIFLHENSISDKLGLKRVICSGEAMSLSLQKHFYEKLPNAELHNLYGPTEASIDVSYWVCSPDFDKHTVPIGKPIDNIKLYILDEYLNIVPIGIVGELYIAGDGLARGYLDRPDLTAKTFIANPYAQELGERLYKTGDLARYQKSGNIEYIGRNDFQVKLRGQRIELGEIENALMSLKGIREAVVVVRERVGEDDGTCSQDLIGYIVLDKKLGKFYNQNELRYYLENQLPTYMIPNYFILLDDLPLSSNGKIDRKSLPEPNDENVLLPEYTQPSTDIENTLVGIWSKSLSIRKERISVNAGFIELGGNSLSATRLISKLRENYSIDISIETLFKNGSISNIALEIDRLDNKKANILQAITSSKLVEEKDRYEKHFDLSYSQKRLWFLEQTKIGDSARYNEPLALAFSGKVNFAAVEAAVHVIINRHDILRTRYIELDGAPKQITNKKLSINIPVLKADKKSAKAMIHNHAIQYLNLETGPIINAALLELEEEKSILLINIHHIACDGWSIELFGKEFVQVYKCLDKNVKPNLKNLSLQFVDYSLKQKTIFKNSEFESQLSYWKRQLSGAPPLLELPTYKNRNNVKSYSGDKYIFTVNGSFIKSLRKVGQDSGATLYMVLLSAFILLLSRYSNQRDILVGTPIAGRKNLEEESLIGFFVNTLVVRSIVDSEMKVVELLNRIKNTAIAAYVNQDVPFDKLVEELGIERNLSYDPLIQVMFALQEVPDKYFSLPNAEANQIVVNTYTSKFDLTLFAINKGESFDFVFEYDTSLFEHDFMCQMGEHFKTTLSHIIRRPNAKIYDYNLVDNRNLLILSGRKTVENKGYKYKENVLSLFSQVANQSPNSIAVNDSSEYITYDLLDSLSNQLAYYFLEKGVSIEEKIGIYLHSSIEMIVGMLAIAKAGCAYVPIDPKYPKNRIEHIVSDSQLKIILTESLLYREIGYIDVPKIRIDVEFDTILNQTANEVENRIEPENIIYVIYTSGSTGRPKGVTISHYNLTSLCRWHKSKFNVDKNSIATQIAGVSFDAMAWEVWPYILAGSSLSIVPNELKLDSKKLVSWLNENHISHSFLPTPIAENFVEEVFPESFPLKYLLTGGDRLKKFPSKDLPYLFFNNYGPTECTVVATSGPVLYREYRVPSIGYAIDNTDLFILDNNLLSVPELVVGEVYIGGEGVARGYLGMPDQTAEKYIPNPFNDARGERIYRTGDLARYKRDGAVEYIGRTDNQVKIRGYRIELGEVETAILSIKGVKEAVVIIHSNSSFDNAHSLIAYVVGEENLSIKDEDIIDILKDSLPSYMIPAGVLFLPEMPLTANGKIDQRALPAPESIGLKEMSYEPPRTGVEIKVLNAWSEVLGRSISSIGIRDNFFEIGGHSLLVTKVLSRLRENESVKIEIKDFFENPTIEKQSFLLEKQKENSNRWYDREIEKLVDSKYDEPDWFVSFSQKRLWFFNQLEEGNDIQYNIPLAFRLEGDLKVPILLRSIYTVVERHEVLRSLYKNIEGTVRQYIYDGILGEVAVIEVSKENVYVQMVSQTQYHFDLSKGPLIRFCLLRLADKTHVLMINVHHIVADGWSMNIFLKEFSQVYSAYLSGKENPLQPLSIQYRDFSYWQNKWLNKNAIKEQVDYWKGNLKGAPELLEMPIDKFRPAKRTYQGDSFTFFLTESLSLDLNKVSQKAGVTLFMTLISAFGLLLSRYSGKNDICVGTPIANRQHRDIENLIGFFVNTLVIRMNPKRELRFDEYLINVRKTALGSYANQDVPFERLVDEIKVNRSLSYSPLFQVMFALQNTESCHNELPDLKIYEMEGVSKTAKFDLTLIMKEVDKGISGWVEYNTDIYDRVTVENMMEHYQCLLNHLVEDITIRCGEISIMTEKEIGDIVVGWNKRQHEYPSEKSIGDAFYSVVENFPEVIALVKDDQQFSYCFLNKVSDFLAGYLLENGLHCEDRVGIFASRSIEMIVALLGVVKAGGVYVPIDSEYPKERISYLLNDCGADFVLIQRRLLENKIDFKNLRFFVLEDIISISENYHVREILPEVRPQNTAYIIYTSGSTGRPKGVTVPHQAIIRLVVNNDYLLIDSGQRILQSASFSFDAATFEIWGALLNGSQCILYPEVVPSVEGLEKVVEEKNVNVVWLTTGLFNLIVDENPKIVSKFDYVLTGGEAASKQHMIQAFDAGAANKILNMYGPTENTTFSTSYSLSRENASSLDSVPIGKSIANSTTYVLDFDGNVVPVGVFGELYVGGDGLARGYHDRPMLTAEKFVPHPFSCSPGQRLYRTGDLVRYKRDGNIDFLGRIDSQVKVRGFRIELSEIEETLVELENILESIVVSVKEEKSHYIVAYLVVKEDCKEIFDLDSLRVDLRKKLPDYMIPSFFVSLDELPLTPNGKVDRKALPAIDDKALFTDDYVAPHTDIEKQLAVIWSEVLRLSMDKIGIRDNFFELGGDSILSIQIASRAHKAGLSVTTRQLFEYQTIEQLAHHAQQTQRQINQTACQGEQPLLPIQKWFLEKPHGNKHQFHQSFLLTVPTDFTYEFLHYVVDALYRRHDALRLHFTQDAAKVWRGEFVPYDRAMTAASCVKVELKADTPAMRQKAVADHAEQVKASFTLDQGPLLRAVYYRAVNEEDSRLLLVIHHMVVDGVSWRVMLDDLSLAYSQWHKGQSIHLPAKTSGYQQWGAHLYAVSDDKHWLAQQPYWLSMLTPVPAIPVDTESVASDTFGDTDYLPIRLNETQTQLLLNRCHQAYHTQINDLLLSALVLALYRWQKLSDIRLTMEGHGRENLSDEIDLTATVGWFTTMYPLRLSVPEAVLAEEGLGELIKLVKEQYRCVPDKGLGYGLLRHLVEDEAVVAAAEQPHSSIVFNYLGQFDQQMSRSHAFSRIDEAAGNDINPSWPRADVLGFNGLIVDDCLQFSVDYNRRQYRLETMVALGEAYESALRAVIAHCQAQQTSEYTPSDFTLVRLSQVDLDRWQTDYRDQGIEDIYPATGMQAGLLYHGLLNEESAYVTQIEWCMPGTTDLGVLKQAWEQVLGRHAIFRTAFVGLDEAQPLQMVLKQVSLPWHEADWRDLSAEAQAAAFKQYRETDKAQGFIADQAPLMRCAVFLESDERYRFLWTHHHSLLDGWCLPIVLDELSESYRQFKGGHRPRLPSAAVYRDYIDWLQRQDHQAAQVFWQQQLQGLTTPTVLGVDKLPVDGAVSGPQEYHYCLSATMTSQLQQVARRYRVTLNTLVQAAWGYLLSHYSGQSRVVFGETVSGRPTDLLRAEEMVGLFINSLPVSMTIDGQAEIRDWLQQLHQAQAQRASFSYLPLVEIKACSEMTREMELFNTLVVFENYPSSEALDETTMVADGTTLSLNELQGYEGTHYDLSLSIGPAEQLQLKVMYRAQTYAVETIARLVGHLRQILGGFTDSTLTRVGELSLLSAPERQQIVFDWNQTQRDYAQDRCVHQWFEEQASRTPERIAVVFGDEQISYRELHERSDQLAIYLQAQGVQADQLVGMVAERSVWMIIGLLGILKAGGAYLTLDPEYPRERLRYMLSDSGVKRLLTQQHLVVDLTPLMTASTELIVLDEQWEKISTTGRDGLRAAARPQAHNLAYVIYTSGSTGKPKGVMVEHASVANTLQFLAYRYPVGAEDSYLLKTNYVFDVSVSELFGWFFGGGRLVILAPGAEKSPRSLIACIKDCRPTHLNFVPSMLSVFIQEARDENAFTQGTALKYLMVAGEAFPKPLVREAVQLFGSTRVENIYGPTESSIYSAWFSCSSEVISSVNTPIGRPVDNTQLYVLDSEGQPRPVGVTGELYIAGAGLARGYLNQPALTAERFLENPFVAGQRLYKTGDLVRWLPDGTIEYLGRNDSQVKVRGFRVELGEIESVIAEQAGIRDVVVIAHRQGRQTENTYLVAYVVLDEGVASAYPSGELRTVLNALLPDHMVPSVFMCLDALPLTVSGKVDRKALPEPEQGDRDMQGYVAPRTPTEEALVAIWSEILQMPSHTLGIHDNFFDLGGHSLLVTRVVSQLYKVFAINLHIRDVFHAGTVQALASVVDHALVDNALHDQHAHPLVVADRQQPLALSFAQQRLWFINQFEAGADTQYNLSWTLRLVGVLDIAALEAAFMALTQRHESLRTTFTTVTDEACQVIEEPVYRPLPVVAIAESDMMAYVAAHMHSAFDLSSGPLWQVQVLRLAPETHALLITMHHIITDGWSIGVFNDELSMFYQAYYQERVPSVPALTIQYADFAQWQRQWLNSDILSEQVDYWTRQLDGAPALLELSTDRPRPATQQYRGRTVRFELSSVLLTQLAAVSRGESTTLFMTLFSGFVALLARYSGQDDINVGTPIANRQRVELEPLIGFFVNTLVLRTRFTESMSFGELLQQVKETALSAYAHQDVPFEYLVEALQPERSLSHSPLFQVMFVLQNTGQQALTLPGVTVTAVENERESAKFDLSMILEESATGINGWLEYDTDLFDLETIERLIRHYQVLLSRMVDALDTSVMRVPLLSESERRQIVFDWNQTQRDYPHNVCVHQCIAQQSLRTPDAVAVIYEDMVLTYGELDGRSNQLARYLLAQGVQVEDRIGLCMERSLEMIVGLLGILKAGAAYVPIDPEYPKSRIDLLLDESNACLLLTQSSLIDRINSNYLTQFILLDNSIWYTEASLLEFSTVKVFAGNLAYVIYTSGSTGLPKGVTVTHKSINRLAFNANYLDISEGISILQAASASFDAAVFEIWVPLLRGGSCILYPERFPTTEKVKELVVRHKITTLFLTTGLFNLLVDELNEPIVGLRNLLTGGEAASKDHMQRLKGIFGDLNIINMYGPTENSTYSTFYYFNGLSNPKNTTVPIGKPISNSTSYIFDKEGDVVPVGVVGELYVGGEGLARGYLGKPDLTADNFVPDTITEKSGERLYRTGDLAKYLPDGNIEFVGREDDQVKIRGFRIELGEVEAGLTDNHAIQDAFVITHQFDERADRHYLIAYIIFDKDFSIEKSLLRSELKENLPEYMMPSYFVVMEKFPLKPSGKIDRDALPPPNIDDLNVYDYVSPRTETERQLVDTWSDVLQLEPGKVSIVENFFDLGGNSLMITRVASKLRRIFKVELPVRDLFKANTIDALARVVDKEISSSLKDQDMLPVQVDRSQPLPLSFAQRRLWFINQLEDGSDAQYNVPWGLRLDGNLNMAALELAFNQIIKRHEILRTIFLSSDQGPIQVVKNPRWINIPIYDVAEEAISEFTNYISLCNFEISSGPLWRVLILRLSSETNVLLVTMHHIITDGWSVDIFNNELSSLYNAYSQGVFLKLPPLPIQYADFSQWQREWLSDDVLDRQIEFWKSELSGAATLLELPTDRPRSATRNYRGSSTLFVISTELTRKITAVSRRESTTLFMTLFSGFVALLARYSGQDDINVGTPIANRQRVELEPLIGFFVNTLVLRTRFTESMSFGELLQQVKETALSAYAHQDVPFEYLVEALQPERSLSHSPLFQVMFVLQNTGQQALTLPGVTVTAVENERESAKFDLSMILEESATGINGWLEYDTDLFDLETIERLIRHYQVLLSRMVDALDTSVMRVPLLSESERRQIVFDWNQTQRDYPHNVCVHQCIAQQSLRTPDAVAVIYEDMVLTYGELDGRSNQLARYLLAQGVQVEDRIGLCMERSLEMIVGLLGILKAGAAYVPIDPGLPQQRIAYFIDDSDVSVIVTHTVASGALVEADYQVVCFDSDASKLASCEKAITKVALKPTTPAYMIYTSGSTGKPKGVLVGHGAYSNHMHWMCDQFAITAEDKVFQKTPLSFDASGWEWSLPLMTGGQLVVAHPGGHRDPDYLLQMIVHQRISVFQGVPSLVGLLLESAAGENLAALRYLFCGGEPLPVSLCEAFRAQGLSAKLCNLYGPTEATIDSTYWLYDGETTLHTVPIGRPIGNVTAYILDEALNPVPIGVRGELYIGGAGLAIGYLGRPELTSSTYIDNPFSTGTKLYKTGDVARWLPDSTIEYIGRNDFQVKIRGFRIELGEIENVILSQSAIQAVAVVDRLRPGGAGAILVAYVVWEAQARKTANTEQIREALRAHLPDYMIPSFFVSLDELPLTPNGKVDRKVLPAVEWDSSDSEISKKPKTVAEKRLCKVWSNVLNIPLKNTSVGADFFELGGHSLLAAKIVNILQKKYGWKIPLRALFEHTTIESLARAIDTGRFEEDHTAYINLKQEAVLDNSIVSGGDSSNFVCHPETIFLTGATGFIGRFLLRELLEKTHATIYCLVRALNRQHAFQRLKIELDKNNLWKPAYKDRVHAVAGDISEPFFGLNDIEFNQLAKSVDVIYHNATAMNHIASYRVLKPTTVGGVQEILRLASAHHIKPVHYSSTTSIFSSGVDSAQNGLKRKVNENTSIDSEEHRVLDGYTGSKWVAEKVVMLAKDLGIPCRIYRFGLVTGDTRYGRYDSDQWLYRLLNSCVRLGVYPKEFSLKLGILPVDIAVKFLVYLSCETELQQEVFHLTNTNTVNVKDFFEIYNKSSNVQKLKPLSFKKWLKELKKQEKNQKKSIYPLMMHLSSNDQGVRSKIKVSSQLTESVLLKGGLFFPRFKRLLLKTYIDSILGSLSS